MKSFKNYRSKMVIFDSNENLGVAFIADDTGSNLPSTDGVDKFVNEERFSQISH
jgi:hypothetical protein